MSSNGDNFKQAAKELFVFGKAEGEGRPVVGDAQVDPEQDFSANFAGVMDMHDPIAEEELFDETDREQTSIVDPAKETSTIAEGMTITGKIRSNGHVRIMGNVKGNIEAEGNVSVGGSVEGDIKGDNLELMNGNVKGKLISESKTLIGSGSSVIGDVSTMSIYVDGLIKGNVEAKRLAISGNSDIDGDITVHELSIEPGAVINGKITTITSAD